MLCPRCGKDVGDSPRLCDDCQALLDAESPREEIPEEEKRQIEDSDLEEEEANDAAEEELPPADDQLWKLIRIGAGVLVAAVLLTFLAARGCASDTAKPQRRAEPAQRPAPPAADQVVYESRSAADQLALWDPRTMQLSVGLFSSKLTQESREQILSEGSLTAVVDHQPDVTATFVMRRVPEYFTIEDVKTYGLVFYKGDKLTFPGDDRRATFFFVGSGEDETRLSGLKGQLKHKKRVSGRLTSAEVKKIDGKDIGFRWLVDFDAEVVDLTANDDSGVIVPNRPVKGLEPTPTPDSVSFARGGVPDVGTLSGSASINNASVQFKTAVALYYADASDLAIGLYVDELSKDEIGAVVKQGVFPATVNNKRPSLVLVFDFFEGTQAASAREVSAYSLYFYRDKFGSFTFPGEHEAMSITRLREQVTKREVHVLNGRLTDGDTVAFDLTGESTVEGTKFAWTLRDTVMVREVGTDTASGPRDGRAILPTRRLRRSHI